MANGDQAERRGPHPFDNNTVSDFVIRSADGHNFYMQKRIVEEASLVLKAILSAPHPSVDNAQPGDYVGDKPVMAVEEEYSAVHMLLRCCYSDGINHILNAYTVRDALNLFHCWDKYEVQVARREGEHAILDISERATFAAFAIACKVDMKALAEKIAAKSVPNSTYDQEMRRLRDEDNGRIATKLLDGLLSTALWEFQERCRNVVKNLTVLSKWIDEEHGRDRLPMRSLESTDCCPETLMEVWLWERDRDDQVVDWEPYNVSCPDQYHVKNWFLAYLAEIKATVQQGSVLEKLSPTHATLRVAAAANDCPKCRGSFDASFPLFVEKFRNRAKYKISQVRCCPVLALLAFLRSRHQVRFKFLVE